MGAVTTCESETLSVTCLCAEWCDVCREYRAGFFALAERFPHAKFAWLDIEDDAEKVGDVEIENFPTLRIERGGAVLFDGPMLPHVEHLARLVRKMIS
jgi:hypothetical protein